MKWSDGIHIAFSSLIENPLRTFLTLFGITIGVTAVIFVVSVIEGLNGYIGDTMGNFGPNAFVINKFGIIKDKADWEKAIQRNKDLRIDDAEAIRKQATLVDKVATQLRSRTTAKYGKTRLSDVSMRGVSFETLEIEPYQVALGRGFLPVEIEHSTPVCFIGSDVAKHLLGNVDPIGRKITLMHHKFTVIGVAEAKGSVFGQSQDNFAMIPISTFGKIHGMHGSVWISIKAKDPLRMEETIDEARSVLRARHHLRFNDEDDFGVITSDGVMRVWRDLTAMIFNVAIFVVSISLVVGGIVIMNIMLLTVVERTREIGIRKAIGARQQDIQFQFLTESIMLCAMGGILGVLVAWSGTWAVRTFTPLPARFPLWAPILAITITSAVGIFFGLHPARQAARLDPIDALRSIDT